MNNNEQCITGFHWRKSVESHQAVLESIINNQSLEENILKAVKTISNSIKHNGKVILLGNGGSASDAQHIAAEFVGRFLINRKPLPAISLSENSSNLTAIANDFSFDDVFSRQIEALAKSEDVVIGITTSGNSNNVLSALEKASEIGAATILLTGNQFDCKNADIVLSVPCSITSVIQEMHIMIGHFLAYAVEMEVCMFSGS